jgi:hypothetical protein
MNLETYQFIAWRGSADQPIIVQQIPPLAQEAIPAAYPWLGRADRPMSITVQDDCLRDAQTVAYATYTADDD